MFSEMIKTSLEREVIGQPAAIASVVRGLTRLASGLTPRERSWCTYLFIGPPGTGRTHLVRTVARLLHGDEQRVLSLNCPAGAQHDPWRTFVQQLAPQFCDQHGRPASLGPPESLPLGIEGRHPPRILLIQDLEAAPKEFFVPLSRLLASGDVVLEDGRRGRLDNTLVFLTSRICSREILDESSHIGFAGTSDQQPDDDDQDSIVKLCNVEAEKHFGLDLLAQLDRLIVFRRLEDEHLGGVLDRHFERMNRWLVPRGFRSEMLPAARDFLLEQGRRHTVFGARDLIVAHRREVEFPLADLIVSGEVPPGGRILIDRQPGAEHLHFTVTGPDATMPTRTGDANTAGDVPVEIPISG